MLELKPHQIDALNSGKRLFFMGTGTGKTVVSYEYMKRRGIDRFVVSTKKMSVNESLKGKQWYEDYILVFGREPKIIELTKKSIKKSDINDYDIIIMSHHFGKFQLLSNGFIDVKTRGLIIDECHKIKNPGKLSRGVIKTGKAGWYAREAVRLFKDFCLLTATPVSTQLFDYANYLAMNGNLTVEQFNQSFVVRGEKRIGYSKILYDQILGYENTELLFNLIKRNSFIFGAVEKITNININEKGITFSSDKALLKKIKKEMMYTTYQGETFDIETNSKLLMELRLASVNTRSEVSPKSEYVYNLIHDDKIGKTIVFYNFTEELYNIQRTFDKLDKENETKTKISIIGDGNKGDDMHDEDVDILCIQYMAGAEALNLKQYKNTVFYSLPQIYFLFKQAKGRNNRLNQTDNLNFYYLLSDADQIIFDKHEENKKIDITEPNENTEVKDEDVLAKWRF